MPREETEPVRNKWGTILYLILACLYLVWGTR